jgi:4-diphosphocytidyl-2-C-methyl-D-erythritol kinase
MSADGYVKGRRPVNTVARLRAPAKVNLHLEVVRQRHDGYHDIETVLQAVTLYDRVTVTLRDRFPGGEPRITLEVEGRADLPADETNLCWRAARHFCRENAVSGELAIALEKRIPLAAGLGGGSSDAAAVLVACDRLFGTGLEPGALERLGAAIGSDVPFFVRGGTQLGRGRGTVLTVLPTVRTGQFLIVKPALDLRTSDVYAGLKMGLTVHSAAANIQVLKPILARFPQQTWPGFNRLEEVVLPAQPSLQRLVVRMRQLAPVAMLSGSGSAGLFARIVGPHVTGVEFTDD